MSEFIFLKMKDVVNIYNSGYHSGHHDTVEGGYIDILQCDMETYHEDVVEGCLAETLSSKQPSCETCKWWDRTGVHGSENWYCMRVHTPVSDPPPQFYCCHWEGKE